MPNYNQNGYIPQQNFQMPYNYTNYIATQPQTPVQSSQYLKCRPVTSREEAMACQIDLDGSLWIFPNIGNGKIYTKQINNDGTATFATYTFTKNENPYNSGEYVTKEEFNQTIQNLMAAIQQQPAAASVQSASTPAENKPL